MNVLIEDSPRNLAKWIVTSVSNGTASGAVFEPFSSPLSTASRRSLDETAAMVVAAGGSIMFDPLTHMLDVPGVGDFRFYDDYQLWSGVRGDLSTPAAIADHVSRVFRRQTSLGARHVGPTNLVRSPLGTEARRALDMATTAKSLDAQTWLTIAGDEQFWSSGANLDAFVGALAQHQPEGWILASVRPTGVLPAPVSRSEVAGIARTTRSLAPNATVHISHGDLAGLPAIAAGASTLGSGWDQKQMLVGGVHFAARSTGGTQQGAWYERPTLRGVLSRIKKTEYDSLSVRASALAGRVTPGILSPLAPRVIFEHHMAQLSDIVGDLQSLAAGRDRYERLRDLYIAAQADWPAVQAAAISDLDNRHWVDELQAGLEVYARGEGW